jgi:hypothetical protein
MQAGLVRDQCRRSRIWFLLTGTFFQSAPHNRVDRKCEDTR